MHARAADPISSEVLCACYISLLIIIGTYIDMYDWARRVRAVRLCAFCFCLHATAGPHNCRIKLYTVHWLCESNTTCLDYSAIVPVLPVSVRRGATRKDAPDTNLAADVFECVFVCCLRATNYSARACYKRRQIVCMGDILVSIHLSTAKRWFRVYVCLCDLPWRLFQMRPSAETIETIDYLHIKHMQIDNCKPNGEH